MKKILCIFFCLLPILGGKAQTLYKDQVRIEKESITRSEDNNVLTINLDIQQSEHGKPYHPESHGSYRSDSSTFLLSRTLSSGPHLA